MRRHPVHAFIASLKPPERPAPVVFIDVRQQLPVGHAFAHGGAIYTTTCWQYRNRLGGWLVALVRIG